MSRVAPVSTTTMAAVAAMMMIMAVAMSASTPPMIGDPPLAPGAVALYGELDGFGLDLNTGGG